MPRVETVIPEQPLFVSLKPKEIKLDPNMLAARPGPVASDEDKRIAELAQSLEQVGQIVPVIVERRDGEYFLIDGRRRHAAALGLKNFELQCAVRTNGATAGALQTAIHANLKRRGYNPLQFAHLVAEVRKLNSWEGSAEVADYLGVSRAQVSQHDKLLVQPEGMSDATYKSLLSQVGSGKMGADTAFFTLTHVDAQKAAEVLPRAKALAAKEAGAKAAAKQTTSPASSNARQKASGKTVAGRKPTAVERKAFALANKEQIRKHKERVAKAKSEAKVTKKHVALAAREAKALKTDIQRTIPDLRVLFQKLESNAYPDVMRSFISNLDIWLRGDASDKDVISHWSQVAQLVEHELERSSKLGTKARVARRMKAANAKRTTNRKAAKKKK